MPADDFAAFAAWVSTRPPAIRADLVALHGRSADSLRRFLRRARPEVERAAALRRRWALVRWAVAVRPWALHWLEEHAKAQETRRIASVAADPRYDPMRDD